MYGNVHTVAARGRGRGEGGRGVFSSVGIRRKINGPNPTFNIIEQKERQSDRQIEREGGG